MLSVVMRYRYIRGLPIEPVVRRYFELRTELNRIENRIMEINKQLDFGNSYVMSGDSMYRIFKGQRFPLSVSRYSLCGDEGSCSGTDLERDLISKWEQRHFFEVRIACTLDRIDSILGIPNDYHKRFICMDGDVIEVGMYRCGGTLHVKKVKDEEISKAS